MVKSLRWRLQLWHATILSIVVVGFGAVLLLQFKWSVLRDVDTTLMSHARALEGTLRMMPRQVLLNGWGENMFPRGDNRTPSERGEVGARPPNPNWGPPADGLPGDRSPPGDRPPGGDRMAPNDRQPAPDRPAPDRPGSDRPGPDRPAPDNRPSFEDRPSPENRPSAEFSDRGGNPDRPPPEAESFPRGPGRDRADRMGPRPRVLSPDQLDQLLQLPVLSADAQGVSRIPDPPYFAIYTTGGQLIKALPRDRLPLFSKSPRGAEYRIQENNRELLLAGPEGTLIIVGQDVRPQFNQLNWLATQLVLTGLAVLLVGLCGGGWLAGRAIRPIRQVQETAARITAANLSERINIDSTDTELRDLAAILNSMLGRLESSFEQQVRFTADASHELRTPLTVLLSHAELALARPRSHLEYQDALSTVQRAGQRMKSLVDDLLTLARANAGRLELRRDEVDLAKLAEEAIQMFQPLAAQRSVSLVTTGAGSVCRGDASRLSQVVANLLVNAIQYNHPGGRVELNAEQVGNRAILTVSDTGPGIPENELPHLFDPFYRVDLARSRESGGSGLGLAICKRIIEAHGGEISVRSQPQRGSTFEVRLPV